MATTSVPIFLTRNTPWYEAHKDTILDSDPAHNLYQLRVIQQKPDECSMHQDRNLLFAMAMYEDNLANFRKEYQRLMDKELFEAMALETTCRLLDSSKEDWTQRNQVGKPTKNETRVRKDPRISELITKSSTYTQFLPQKSPLYINEIIEFSRYINEKKYNKAISEIEFLAKENIHLIEGKSFQKDHIFDAALLINRSYSWLDYSDNLIKLYEKFSSSQDFLLPIKLNLNSVGEIWHATGLVIKRHETVMEFIFMDPLNWRITTTESYQKVVQSLIRFAKDPSYFKETMIRSGYINALINADFANDNSDPRWKVYELFSYLKLLEDLDLKKDYFFTNYYHEPICQLINKATSGPPRSIELRLGSQLTNVELVFYPDAKAELVKRFSCSQMEVRAY